MSRIVIKSGARARITLPAGRSKALAALALAILVAAGAGGCTPAGQTAGDPDASAASAVDSSTASTDAADAKTAQSEETAGTDTGGETAGEPESSSAARTPAVVGVTTLAAVNCTDTIGFAFDQIQYLDNGILVTFTYTNGGDSEYQYGDCYALEQMVGGEWYGLAPAESDTEYGWAAVAYPLEPGKSEPWSIRLTYYGDTFQPGTYRLIKVDKVTVNRYQDEVTYWDEDGDYLAAEFLIEDDVSPGTVRTADEIASDIEVANAPAVFNIFDSAALTVEDFVDGDSFRFPLFPEDLTESGTAALKENFETYFGVDYETFMNAFDEWTANPEDLSACPSAFTLEGLPAVAGWFSDQQGSALGITIEFRLGDVDAETAHAAYETIREKLETSCEGSLSQYVSKDGKTAVRLTSDQKDGLMTPKYLTITYSGDAS